MPTVIVEATDVSRTGIAAALSARARRREE
jgi:hypothetical protein